jgi:hypothetical protein
MIGMAARSGTRSRRLLPERAATEQALPGSGQAGSIGGDRQGSADGRLEGLAQRNRLVRRQLDHQPPAALKRDAHHDAATLFGDLERTVACPRLHRRHPPSPFLPGGRSNPRCLRRLLRCLAGPASHNYVDQYLYYPEFRPAVLTISFPTPAPPSALAVP